MLKEICDVQTENGSILPLYLITKYKKAFSYHLRSTFGFSKNNTIIKFLNKNVLKLTWTICRNLELLCELQEGDREIVLSRFMLLLGKQKTDSYRR